MGTNTTAKPRIAMSRESFRKLEDFYSEITEIQHMANYLLNSLEYGFSDDRIQKVSGETITLMFQQDGVDANLWLVGEVWSRTKKLRQQITDLINLEVDHLEVAA
ncbi:hypothetical protein JYU29_06030 [Tianweitania sp. BSSL-BM11]|uniref:Uncharacterized protein n=1 Tax=Tianweitania aestuarii TaxID=2814886 RepID=A0ABS5RT62_9HYPH|nr:hypothetical protein [Tianweitania aestuarii]MBS9720243.1 hypothetical protein [Tianweitania aestuarii]